MSGKAAKRDRFFGRRQQRKPIEAAERPQDEKKLPNPMRRDDWVRWLELQRELESPEIQDWYIDGSFPMRSLVTAPIVIRISNEIKKGFVTYASGNSSPGAKSRLFTPSRAASFSVKQEAPDVVAAGGACALLLQEWAEDCCGYWLPIAFSVTTLISAFPA
jgi:hypothetical protein